MPGTAPIQFGRPFFVGLHCEGVARVLNCKTAAKLEAPGEAAKMAIFGVVTPEVTLAVVTGMTER